MTKNVRENASVSIMEMLEKQGFVPTTNKEELSEKKAKAKKAVENLQAAYDGKKFDEVEALIATAKADIDEFDKYNTVCVYESFFANANPNPLESALKKCYIEKYKLNDIVKEGIHTVSLGKKDTVIDVKDFTSKTKSFRLIGTKLLQKAERFCYLTAVKMAYGLDKKVGIVNEAFGSSSKWKKTGLSTNVKKEPTKTELLNALQEVFDELYYIDNKGQNLWQAKERDVNFMEQCLFLGKNVTKLKLNLATAKKAISVATEQAYAHINEKFYEIALDEETSF